MGKKKSHEAWEKEQALLKKQKQEQEDEKMDVVGAQSDLLELEANLQDSDDDLAPMDVDHPRNAKSTKLKPKKIEKASVKKRKAKSAEKALMYTERWEILCFVIAF